MDKRSALDDRKPLPDGNALSGSRQARESVLLAAEVSHFGDAAVTKHRLRDLSPEGAKLDNADAFRPGETILITVGSLAAVGATVVWVAGAAAGVRFFETIDPASARSKTIVNHQPARRALKPSDPSPERKAELADWLADLNDTHG